MSSILKALKKIDEESPAPQSFPSLPRTIDAKRAINSQIRKRWLWRKIITVFLILVFIVVAGVFLLNRKERILAKLFPAKYSTSSDAAIKTPSEKSKVFRAKITPESKKTIPASPPSLPAKEQIKPVAPKSTAKKYSADMRQPQPMTAPARKVPQAGPTATVQPKKPAVQRQKPIKKSIMPQNMPTSEKSVAERSEVTDKPATSPPKPTRVAYDRIDDTKLKLQALAWFKDASKRMAVINDRIVREGESVDGYQITQIRQEDVVVNDGSKSWLLEFGLKQ